ncbi:MAG TPA: flagellar export chaperone FliS [Clostridiaceae bacterium]|jgi:flagellar protein FliS|nr:flagellar export chaperone FliS [Clostridiaceae bacterium]
MIAYNAYNQYKENSIFTASPEELTLMLYNGLVKFIMRGMDSIEKRDIPDANTNIIKAQNIISELMNTLDMKYGLSSSLYSIYDYMLRRLIDANIAKDKEILEEILGFAKILRDTWEQAMKISRQQNRRPTVTNV